MKRHFHYQEPLTMAGKLVLLKPTDVKFSSFGEGSFDKGITLKAPLSWFTGRKSQAYRKTVIRPITGDGELDFY